MNTLFRRSAFVIFFVLACATAAAASPAASWLTYRHNFGAFDEDQGSVSCEFLFVNTGDAPLTVLAARASCGCTQPVFPREAIAPGDTAAILVTYDPQGRPGRFRKTIQVETDAPDAPKTKLTIEGVVIGARSSVDAQYPVARGPLHFRRPAVMFGQLVKPHLKTVFTDAYNRSPDSIRPRVVSKPRYVDVNFEPSVVGPGEQLTVICYFRSADASLWGLVEDSLVLSAGSGRFALPFTAMVKEDFSSLSPAELAEAPHGRLSESSLDFGRISRTDAPLKRTVTLTNTGSSSLLVRRVYSADRGVTATVDRDSIKKGRAASITVTVDPAAVTSDMLNAAVSVITNDPDRPVTSLRIVGELLQ